MLNKKEDELCWVDECTYKKPHKHIRTNDGSYVKYIIEKPKANANKENYDADTW
jgi:hypothetical protein